MARINICIPTYNRNDGLLALLDSLRALEPVEAGDVDVSILVIDNNPDGRAGAVIETIKSAGYPLDISYVHELRPGVSHVRNTAIDSSQSADFLAFIDDDETVTPVWLAALWQRYLGSKAAIVFGPTQAVYPDDTPDWMIEGDFHSGRIDNDELRTTPGSVANVLMDLEIIRRDGLTFDTTISEIGGEDTLLFTQMLAAGEVLANAKDALVYDHVPPERVKPLWLMQRWRRTGWTDAMVKYRNHARLHGRLRALLDGLIRIAAGSLLSSFRYLASGMKMSASVARGLYTLQRGLGMMDFARDRIIREYGRKKNTG